MRKDTSFSERKLTEEEFSKKYWMDGKFPYQYHTASIEDARDEREQFVFNNLRALWDLGISRGRNNSIWEENVRSQIKELKKRTTTLTVISVAALSLNIFVIILSLL